MKLHKLTILLAILAMSCSDNDLLDGFDKQAWQSDKDGCHGERLSLIEDLLNQREELVGLGQEEIKAVLGKPDRHELQSRNKKSFIYYVAGGPTCEQALANPKKFVIRFDGVGRAKDLVYYKK